MEANGRRRSGSVYTYALAAIGVGYVVLLVVLLNDSRARRALAISTSARPHSWWLDRQPMWRSNMASSERV